MRNSCAARSPRPATPRQHSFQDSVQSAAITRELTTALVAPIHHAAYGAKVGESSLTMLAKNVQRQKTVETWVRIVDGAIRLHVATDLIEHHCHLMLAYIRRAEPVSTRSLGELLAIETVLQSQIDPLQWQFALDTGNGFLRRQLIAKVRRAIRNLQELLSRLERDEIDDITKGRTQ